MSVWNCGPQSGNLVPAMRARPIATPACVTMLIQNSRLCSGLVPLNSQPKAEPA
jgi:hypothetical protein